MENTLPKNWAFVNLKDSVDFRKGKKPKILSEDYFDGSVPYMDIQGLEKEIVSFYSDSESAKYFKDNDVVIVWDGSRSGLILKPKEGAIGSTLGALSPYGYKSEYLYYFLLSHYETINSKARGVGIPHVDPTYLWNLELPLPPLPEQERIVAKLDALFAQHEKMKQALDKIPQLLKDFRQQVLSLAITGKLTEEWREGKDLEEWKEEKLENLAIKITDGAHNVPKTLESGWPYIMAKDLTGGFLDFSQQNFISEKDHRELFKKCNPEIGDLLIVNIGAGTGNNVLVNVEFEFSFKNIAIVKAIRTLLNTSYLKYFFDSEKKKIMIEQARGGAQPFLSLKMIKSLNIPLPPLPEQQEIVSRVEALFAKADAIKARYQKLKEKIEALPQALLHKAFKGELVPQLPTDGDAKDLLAEILKLKEEAKHKGKKK